MLRTRDYFYKLEEVVLLLNGCRVVVLRSSPHLLCSSPNCGEATPHAIPSNTKMRGVLHSLLRQRCRFTQWTRGKVLQRLRVWAAETQLRLGDFPALDKKHKQPEPKS
mmetsp:Transcript_15717/g.36084  ORF Transcript_15717/g.36084 Transcript_15717/m.36084 type:complete len:108 (+) Transcript_15717:322-645(+)